MTNEELFLEQKERCTRLMRRRGWTLNMFTRGKSKTIYATASKRHQGKIKRAYIGALGRLPAMSDEQIASKLPDVA
jgi:hypothetical protein